MRDKKELLRQVFADVPALKPLFLGLADDISPVYLASTYLGLSTRNYGGDLDSRAVLGNVIYRSASETTASSV
ncbi:hypothetical protein [Cupriavidus oxalaticus]|uniref:Uncharacterized protein n=1 Tax=Cupriavidus oxalaticus TaxID=96344 RepID=A0ABX7HNA8_9BURK|nr:hypothetical protein [Cupriavidus oxalaticus]QRQ84293.1 hypothetical protein JTE91_11000 [Cupriavidus oxalaticus]QRQ91621.1 hypothetical protein JTE92_01345 [Cupriavidus oxalaticus]WQD86196.1 hypothetical protein U0036_19440 [Cupriavidus oxalaticus]